MLSCKLREVKKVNCEEESLLNQTNTLNNNSGHSEEAKEKLDLQFMGIAQKEVRI